jgi:hypothetical protein
VQVLQAIAGGLRIDHRWLTERVAEASIGLMCTKQDKAGLHALAEAQQTPYGHMLARCFPLTASACLWESSRDSGVPSGDPLAFVEQLLVESEVGNIEVVCRTSTTLQRTKLELVYHAAEAMQWQDGIPQECKRVISCLQLLHSRATGRCAAKDATIREMITVETAEFFLQLMGESLDEHSSTILVSKGRRMEHGLSGPWQSPAGKGSAPPSASNSHKQLVTKSKPRQPLALARTVVLLLWVMDVEACVHALHFISVLSLCLHSDFVGEVRVLAIQGMQKLVSTLHNHAPDMLRQVAAQIVSHLLAVLPSNLGHHSCPAALRRVLNEEKAAATTLLHEIVVNMKGVLMGRQELGEENALQGFPPVPDEFDIPELRTVRQVRHSHCLVYTSLIHHHTSC